MNKNYFFTFLLFIFFLIVLNIFILSKTNISKEKNQKETIPSYNIIFNQGLTHSNLYAPENINGQITTSNTARISWNFTQKKLIVPKGLAKEYAILSGFRVYRDGFWFEDVPKNMNYIEDKGLYPGETSTYEVSALTFDDKIEGSSSSAAVVSMPNGQFNPIISYDKGNFSSYLAEGDSITFGVGAGKGSGWADQTANYIKTTNTNLNFINAGTVGAYSSDVAGRIGDEVSKYNPDLVTIAVGVNDLYAASNPLGNVPLSYYKENLIKIVSEAKPSRERRVILLNIFYIKGESGKEKDWNKVVKEVGNQFGVKVLDIYDFMKNNGGDILLTGDLHPNSNGHYLIAKEVIRELNYKLK